MHSFILYTALHYETLYHYAYVWHNYIVYTYTHKHVHYTYMYMHAYAHTCDWASKKGPSWHKIYIIIK